jgi:hypothetical protein
MRGRTLPPIPANLDPALLAWARAVEAIVLSQPTWSLISTANGPNASGHTANLGDFAVDVGSSVTRLWQKHSASTSTVGWNAFLWS